MAPLETIYEESGSFVTATNNSCPLVNNHAYTDETINGLISARSIAPVNLQRQQRAIVNCTKPPIEVRFRDGSKRYIPPSSKNTVMMSRRKFTDSSVPDLSSNGMPVDKYQHFFNSNTFNRNTSQRKPPVVITVITVNDMRRAGFTPTDSSSPETTSSISTPSLSKSISNVTQTFSSSTLSLPISNISQPLSSFSQRVPTQQSILSQTHSNTSDGTGKTKKSMHKVSFAPLPPMTPVQSLMQQNINQSLANTVLPTNLPRLSPHYSIASNSSRNSTPSQSLTLDTSSISSVLNSNSKSPNPSLQTNLSSTRNTPLNTTPKPSQRTVPNTTNIAIVGGSHSAFRPFLRQMRLNQKSFPITKRIPLNINGRMYRPTQEQQQQMLSYLQNYHQHRQQRNPTTSSMNITSIPNKIQNENYSSNYQDQSTSSNSIVDNSFDVRDLLHTSTAISPNPAVSLVANPNTNWFNITSSSIYDIPKLSRQYNRIPLRINVPVSSPHLNQKLLTHHDTALEQRLLNAGLSPETVALYERILDVAQNRPISVVPSTNAFDQNLYNSLS